MGAVELIYKNTRKSRGVFKGIQGFKKIDWKKEEWEELISIRRKMRKFKSKRPTGYKWDPLYNRGREY